MKLGTFVLGGLAGAAVVMMMRNRTMSAVTDGMGQMMKQRFNQVKETALEKGMNVKFGGGIMGGASGRNGSQSRSGSSGGNESSNRSGGLDRVEHIASQDPKVKHEVNDILEQNGHPQM